MARDEVSFPSGGLRLRGVLFRPTGSARAPAILFNHGSEKEWDAERERAMARLFVERGYVFFLPYRRGHGGSPGLFIRISIARLSLSRL